MGLRALFRRTAVVVAAVLAGTLGLVAVSVPASAADPCGPGGNPVVCENSKPGADPSQWDIVGAGSPELQGYATDISVNAGQPIDFKIDTTASHYTIDIYRTGWYGGLGARHIASVNPSAQLPQHQPECVSDLTTELYDCGNWAVSATWDVPADAVSGVYIALLSDDADGWWSHITFVVRNDDSHADVVFQTSDPTWQAYNTYGGSDFYQGAANGRAYKISYNRPFATRGHENGRDFYFSSEYAMVRFLERNGYDVTYLAGVDADRHGDLLLNHKAFLSVGHDEYWSGGQRANVEAARDAGVNLAFFSGNEVYWRTRYEPSIAGTPTDYRTLVSYKETWGDDKIDPSTEWTGTWRDPRFAAAADGGGLPENALTGTMYMSNFSDLPVTVSAEEGRYRLWRNTSLASLPTGTTQALAPHTVGYESNEDLDNGFRPAGLARLSTTTGPVPQYLQDFGNVVLPGTTTHHVTQYRAASGALVFSAASIQWAWGLDQTHDGAGAPADARMQQATVNVLADMGARATTITAGLVASAPSTDTTAPTAAITSPAAGAAVANGTSVTVTGTAADTGGRVAGVEVSTDGGATWHPATGTTSWSYTYVQSGLGDASVSARAVDDSANLGAPVTVALGVACPCSIYGATVPAVTSADDSSALELGLAFTPTADGFVTGVRFYKGEGNDGPHTGTLWNEAGEALATVAFTAETATGWQTATFAQAVPVSAGVRYVVSYSAPVGHYAVQRDAFWYAPLSAPPLSVAGGFGHSASGTFGVAGSFPTESYESSQYYVDVLFSDADSSPLSILRQTPYPGSGSVPVTASVSAVFSRPPAEGSAAVSLVADGGAAVAGATAYDPATRTVTFTPSEPLTPSTGYTATVAGTAGGQGVTGPASWSFRTAAADQQPGATTVSFYDESATPAILEAADPVPVTLGVRFASAVDGYVTGVRFYKGPENTGTHVGALWALGGTQPLAQATFTDETSTGWQTVTFGTPVRVTKDTEYVASYRTSVGYYSATLGAFSGTGVQRDPLRTAPDSGAFTYASGYPGSTSSTSYFVDVIFAPDDVALTVTGQTPAPGELAASATAPVSASFSLPLAAGAALAVTGPGGAAVAGSSVLSADGRTLTFTPVSRLADATAYTATATGLTATDGSALADVSWAFTTAAAQGCPCTLFGSDVPQTAAANDTGAVELGVAFVPAEDGLVTGVRFYKGEGNGGTHTGALWSADGQRLRSVTFADETASGWQTATFATPFEAKAGTTYVVSYLAPQGRYAASGGWFAADVSHGPLSAPAAGNGRFRYGGGFPEDTWQQTNYFVDVVFSPAARTLPTVTAVSPAAGATGVAVGTAVTATVSAAPAGAVPTLELSTADGPVAGTSAFDAASLTVTFTPAAALPAGAEVSARATVGGDALEGGSWTFTTKPPITPVSLWSDRDLPAYPAWNDHLPLQVGTRFTTSVAGSATAVRFYKGAANTGAHTVALWGPDGTLLASAPSTAESDEGWQTVALPEPVVLTPGQVYTVAYQSAGGAYAVTPGALAAAVAVGPLSTVADGGAYVYGDGSAFPGDTSSAWYAVDPVFLPAG